MREPLEFHQVIQEIENENGSPGRYAAARSDSTNKG